jgi:hypothetical protein
MLVDGLIRSRESLSLLAKATHGGAGTGVGAAGRGRAGRSEMPDFDDADEARKLGSDMYLKVLLADLMSSVRVVKTKTGARLEAIAPEASPAVVAEIDRPPRIEVFQAQCARLASWAEHRSERAPEILSQLGPQTPYFAAILHITPARTPATLEWLSAAMLFASVVIQRVKQVLVCPRPSALDPTIQPIVDNPPFSALPSGHATEAFMSALLLHDVVGGAADDLRVQLLSLAHRIAANRVVAGVHYPIDSIAGWALAQSLAEYFICACGGSRRWAARRFACAPKADDFAAFASVDIRQEDVLNPNAKPSYEPHVMVTSNSKEVRPRGSERMTLLADLYRRAQQEWQ